MASFADASLGRGRWNAASIDTPADRVALNLAMRCGAIPLANFIAHDYDDTVLIDYREFDAGVKARSSSVSSHGSKESGEDALMGDDPDDSCSDPDDMDVDPSSICTIRRRDPSVGRKHCRDGGDRHVGGDPLRTVYSPSGRAALDPGLLARDEARAMALDQLHEACMRVSGTTEALVFEFLGDDLSGGLLCSTLKQPVSHPYPQGCDAC